MSQGEHSACLRDSPCHSVSFVCDKTPLTDPGAISAYERVFVAPSFTSVRNHFAV